MTEFIIRWPAPESKAELTGCLRIFVIMVGDEHRRLSLDQGDLHQDVLFRGVILGVASCPAA